MKAGKRIEPTTYAGATILFSDLVNFTTLCGSSTPIEIVAFLNKLYSAFDAVINVRCLYKVQLFSVSI